MDVLAEFLKPLGFKVERMRFGNIENLYARIGTQSPHFCFAGHTDVVPPGDVASWKNDPFAPALHDGALYGRGAVDMKGAIAAFLCAAEAFLKQNKKPNGSLSLLITGDEEGEAVNGTRKMLDTLRARGETIDCCLVGEPSNRQQLGDMIKIGRRGSLSAAITLYGTQGHVAYPEQADNPVWKAAELCLRLSNHTIDGGNADFQPSNLVVTAIETGNPTTNVIPEKATLRLNIRFNNQVTRDGLTDWLHIMCREKGYRYTMTTRGEGEAFLIENKEFAEKVSAIVEEVSGQKPKLDTLGGTSDARFIKEMCPVLEFGLVGASMHKVNEHVPVKDLELLQVIYERILQSMLG